MDLERWTIDEIDETGVRILSARLDDAIARPLIGELPGIHELHRYGRGPGRRDPGLQRHLGDLAVNVETAPLSSWGPEVAGWIDGDELRAAVRTVIHRGVAFGIPRRARLREGEVYLMFLASGAEEPHEAGLEVSLWTLDRGLREPARARVIDVWNITSAARRAMTILYNRVCYPDASQMSRTDRGGEDRVLG